MLARRFLASLLLVQLTWLAPPAIAQESSQFYEQAVQAFDEKKYTEAYIHLKNVLQEDPDHVSARLLLAEVHFSVGDFSGAEKEAAEALLLGADVNLVLPVYGPSLILQRKTTRLFELDKVAHDFTRENQFEWAMLKGQGYLIDGDRESGLKAFEEAARMFPEDVRSNNTLAAVYLTSELPEKARQHIDKSMSLDAKNAKTWELRGELALVDGGYQEALPYFEAAFELDPRDIKVLRALARSHLELGNREETARFLGLMLEVSPEDPAATLISAVMMIGEGDQASGDSMLADLSNQLSEMGFVQNQSNDAMVFIQASADYVRGSDGSAIALFNSYLSRNRGDLAAIRMLVDLYLRNDNAREAVEFLDTHQPEIADDIPLQMKLVHLYIVSDKIYAARKLLEKLKQQTSADNPYMLLLEGELLQAKGMPAEALALLGIYDFGDDTPLAYSLLQGSLELQLQRLPEAARRVEALRASYPDNIRVLSFCAVVYLALDERSAAQECIRLGLAQAPGNIELRFSEAMLLKKRGEYEASGKLLNAILEENSSHTRSILLMARMLMLQERYDEAIDWSNRVYAYDRNAVRPAELQLDIYEVTDDWDSARSTAVQLARAQPNNTDYIERIARIYVKLGERDLAQSRYGRLRELWAKEPERLRYLATLQAAAGFTAEARLSLEAALEREPASYQTQIALTRLNVLDGEYKRALSMSQSLKKQYGDNAEIAYIEGELALAQGREQDAHGAFLRAFELDRTNLDALRGLYDLSLQGVGGEAFTRSLEAGLREGSLPAIAVRLLADTYLVQGRLAEAAAYYEKLLALPMFATDVDILNNLANIYAEDDLEKALATAQRALQANSQHSSALLDTTGWILSRQGEHEEALFYLRQAFAKNSTDPEIRYHTAVSLNALGRTGEAMRELRAALATGEDFAARAEAESLLASLEG